VLEAVAEAVDRIEADALERTGPGAAPVTAVTRDQLKPEHFRYFALREQIDRVRRMAGQLSEELESPEVTRVLADHASVRIPRSELSAWRIRNEKTERVLWRAIVAAEEVNQYLADLVRSARPFGATVGDRVEQALHEASLLEAMSAGAPGEDRAVLHLRSLGSSAGWTCGSLHKAYERLFGDRYGMGCTVLAEPGRSDSPDWLERGSVLMLMESPGALRLARAEAGTHVFFPAEGGMQPAQVRAIALPPGADPVQAARGDARARQDWRSALAAGSAGPGQDPWALGPVVRVYEGESKVIDLRSGLLQHAVGDSIPSLLPFLLSQLPAPAEVAEVLENSK
jgi:hypothetical protein